MMEANEQEYRIVTIPVTKEMRRMLDIVEEEIKAGRMPPYQSLDDFMNDAVAQYLVLLRSQTRAQKN